jgi:hypothetical protein
VGMVLCAYRFYISKPTVIAQSNEAAYYLFRQMIRNGRIIHLIL